ncbi:MAG: VWA domain-containing protein [bacterium]
MSQFYQFHFLRPEWLMMLPVCAAALWVLWRRINRSTQWEGQCDPALLRILLVGAGTGKQWVPLAGLGLIWLITLVALAGATWEQKPQPVFNKLKSRILVLDLSHSMDSTDIAPTRLERARFKLTDLISTAGDRQQSLIVFAGDAFVVSPFTDDAKTLVNLIPSLTTQTVPVQGSRIDKALVLAQDLIENAEVSNVEIILMTDGINSPSQELAVELAANGHRIHVLSIGTAEGAPIPISGGGLLKDASGSIVIPGVKLNELKSLAAAGRGQYLQMSPDNNDINALNRSNEAPLVGDFSSGERTDLVADDWVDSGIWLLFPLLLISTFSFRRGWIICMVVLLQFPDQAAYAFGWSDLWTRPDQQAATALADQNPALVSERSSPEWRGAAAYRQGEHAAAAEHFNQLDTAIAHYNRANSLAKAGELGESLSAYDQALSLLPDMEDAKFNRELVEKLQKQQQQSQPEQSPSNQNQNQEQQNQSQEERESGDSAGSQDMSEDQSDTAQRPENQNTQQSQHSNQSTVREQEENSRDDGEDQQQGSNQNSEAADSQSGTDQGMGQMDENQQALNQWLKQIPDDPGGLLRRKFRYQYSLRPEKSAEAQKW